MLVKVGSIEKNDYILYKDNIYVVLEREFFKPGKGASVVRLNLKQMKENYTLKTTLKIQETVERIEVDTVKAQYLYQDHHDFIFMDELNYEQFSLSKKELGNKVLFLILENTYTLLFYHETFLLLRLAPKMSFLVESVEVAIKGDTVNKTMTLAKLETGLEVKVPLFIKAGERIIINTESEEYVERDNR